jgi:hypothetical protein
MKFRGIGRFYFRPKNNKREAKPDNMMGVLLSGMIAFMEPTLSDKVNGIDAHLSEIPCEKLANVRITIEVLDVYDVEDDTSAGNVTRWRVDQILTSRFYSHPEEFEGVKKRMVGK